MNNFKYKGYTPVKKGDKVSVNTDMYDVEAEWRTATVRDALASQFTVLYRKKQYFFKYTDVGATWLKAKTSA